MSTTSTTVHTHPELSCHAAQIHRVLQSARYELLNDSPRARDVADIASDLCVRHVACSLAAHETRQLWQIDHFIETVSGNSERLCEDCNAEIPTQRLHALPTATRCTTCQTQQERYERVGCRPSAFSRTR